MEWGKQMEIDQNNARISFYQNTNYNNERNDYQQLSIDVSMSDVTLDCTQLDELEKKKYITKFKIKLYEPLKIDCLSDIFLTQFITFNGMTHEQDESGETMAYVLKIKEFCDNTNYGTNIFNRDLNDNSCRNPCAKYDSDKQGSIIISNNCENNKCKCVKHCNNILEYVSTINSITITELNGTITNAGRVNYDHNCNGKPLIYESAFKDNGRFIATFLIKNK